MHINRMNITINTILLIVIYMVGGQTDPPFGPARGGGRTSIKQAWVRAQALFMVLAWVTVQTWVRVQALVSGQARVRVPP